MKAIVQDRYGGPEVLRLEDLPKPEPGNDQVLIRVRAASVNPLDWHLMRADPFFVRFTGQGLLKPKHRTPGADMSGVVEAVGPQVKMFSPGDEVFGEASEGGFGGFADYATPPERGLVHKPASMSFEEAASIPVAGLTALQGLRDSGAVKPGQRVLINGASGGVGTFAVQIAKHFGAEVTGVCSEKNVELVRSLGADRVIDYTREDFTAEGEIYDVLLDAAAYRPISEAQRAVRRGGKYILIGGSMRQFAEILLKGFWLSRRRAKEIKPMLAKVRQEDLELLRELVETGKVKPVIGRTFSLAEVPEAIRQMESGHTRGKLVVVMGTQSS